MDFLTGVLSVTPFALTSNPHQLNVASITKSNHRATKESAGVFPTLAHMQDVDIERRKYRLQGN